ncbi:MAG: metallophosphoesterase [Oscillospiraceae bacterium]|jgi:predicted MPP superfamily phosphohydrolase|nr:metallophosphoesterase [Oscillospiraceae bacterium]
MSKESAPKREPAPRRRKRKRPTLWVSAFLLVCLAVEGYVSNRVLETSRYTIVSERLPAAFDGFKIVHLSDWHDARFGPDNRELIELVRAEKPDMIALTGDFVEFLSDLPDMESLCRALVDIAPTYYVTGNHEWARVIVRPLRALLDSCGVVNLDNRVETISRNGASIRLVGIEDLNGPSDQRPLSEMVARARDGEDPYLVMLCHRYDRWNEFVAQRVDLALTGHAHGGIIRLPFTDGIYGPGRVFFPQHTSGVTQEGRVFMVASRGLGTARHLPLRLFNRPEVVSVTLKAVAP